MEQFNTVDFRPNSVSSGANMMLTIFDDRKQPFSVVLDAFRKDCVMFGRGSGNDIALESTLVSGHPSHGRFIRENGRWRIEDLNSTNGLICNNQYIQVRYLQDGDLFRIDRQGQSLGNGVLILASSWQNNMVWKHIPLAESITIGRSTDCDIVLPHVSVSKHHARVFCVNGLWILEDMQSTNGVILNNRQIHGRAQLREKDVISIINTRLIITAAGIYYNYSSNGISVDVSDVVVTRGKYTIADHISFSVRPGELIAIVGGSGAGKSTVLKSMCGYLKPTSGNIYFNGIDLYQNFEAMKRTFGYVPQSDIVYDNLTLWNMLLYTAKLRLPKDIGEAERDAAIMKAIRTVGLEDRKDHLIRQLSGGQRKRASIAVELLSDPKLLFLDEPASGLDPGTERNLMQSLRQMANSGKTVILVTHSTLQLAMCDRIAFIGTGGNLCYFGSYADALCFFSVRDVVDVYDLTEKNALLYKAAYNRSVPPAGRPQPGEIPKAKRTGALRQLPALCSRYLQLILNDRQRFLLLLIQAPLLAVLISVVADGEEFRQYEATKSLLFTLSCSAFWVGMLNAIQEICKEKNILKREYMTGLSLGSYLTSKVLILGLMCLIQSVLLTGAFVLLIGKPDSGILTAPFPELLLVTFLTAMAASATGLFVSALFTNADRAMTVAPLLLMPQMLYSGILFKQKGLAKSLSWFTICRWSMEGYGTTADLNALPQLLEQQGLVFERSAEDFFNYTREHFLTACGILLLYTLALLIVTRIALQRMRKE